MEKISTLVRTFIVMLLAISVFSSCSKSSAEAPSDEQLGPKETIVLPMFDANNVEVGSVYLDKMNSGRAQARIDVNEGYYSAGNSLKANATVGSNVYATCTDVDGKTGKCSTFPIKVTSNNSDAMFSDISNNNTLVFNVMDENGNVLYKTARYVVILHQ